MLRHHVSARRGECRQSARVLNQYSQLQRSRIDGIVGPCQRARRIDDSMSLWCQPARSRLSRDTQFAMAGLTCSCDQVERADWCEKCRGYGRRKFKLRYAYYLTRLFRSTQRCGCKATTGAVPHYGLPRFVRWTHAARAARQMGICDQRRR